MSSRWCWRDADDSLTWLQGRAQAHDVLSLLTHLPLADALLLARLGGLERESAAYHHINLLRRAGLIAATRLPLGPGSSPHRFYLTDLGLATLALEWDCEPSALARRFHLRRADLFALLPGLPQLTAAYEVLGALAASQPGRPSLLAWERPWRGRYRSPTVKTWTSISLPALARISWGSTPQAYLIIPDLETIPLRHYRTVLSRLLLFRRLEHSSLPPVVIATGHGRFGGWTELLEETARVRSERPLVAYVVAWQDLHAGLGEVAKRNRTDEEHVDDISRPVNLPPPQHRPGSARLPTLVGDPFAVHTSAPEPNAVVLALSPAERALLDLIARHPFLTPDHIATVLGWQVETVRRRRNRLLAVGLMRLLTVAEIGEEAGKELVEVTGSGLRLVAAQQGLTLGAAVRVHGLVGGEREDPIGVRNILLRNLAHTAGADELFVGLYRAARDLRMAGGDDAVTVWQNAAACSRRHLRPDGYGTYRRNGQLHGFFLEYDRGTINRRDYFRKFAAYYDYAITRRFEWDYRGYPMILVVTTNNRAEDRIAQVARATAVGRSVSLPLLLTCRWRIDDLNNPDGLLGGIWRTPDTTSAARRYWLPQFRSTLSVDRHRRTACPRHF